MSDLGNISSPQELRNAIKGRSDAEIVEGVKAQGIDNVLDLVFAGMKTAFLAAKAGGQSAVIQYDLDTPDGKKSYQIIVKDGECNIVKDGTEKARVTLILNLSNFLKLITNNLNGMQAFMTGALKVTGDVMFAQTMQGWFDQPK